MTGAESGGKKLPGWVKNGWRWVCRAVGGAALLLTAAILLPLLRDGLRSGLSLLAFGLPPRAGEELVEESKAGEEAEAEAPLLFLSLDAPLPEEAPEERAEIPAGVVTLDLSSDDPFRLMNMTASLHPDGKAILAAWESARSNAKPAVMTLAAEQAPTVLVIHTHATEAFGGSADDPAPRSDDCGENMVAVGDAFCEALEAAGVSAIHCRELLDGPDFSGAYDREREAILAYLRQYPSIRYVFDLHRDAVDRSGAPVRTLCESEAAAQMMFVVGTNEKGAAHPNWQQNYGFALHLQSALIAAHPGLMRAINLRGASFNEQYTSGSLLVEIGSAANTLEEAKTAARILAAAVAETMGK